MDEGRDGWSESFQLIRTDPDQEPAIVLYASRESGTKASACADTNAPLVDSGCVRDSGKLEDANRVIKTVESFGETQTFGWRVQR